ncbi:MAG: transposase, partial [Planctomycetota bacterium]
MARLARVVLPGRPHHVTQRGVRSMKIFRDDDDRELYLELMATMAAENGVTFAGWCLMSNHVHLIAVPRRADSLARAIGEAHRRYTRAVNRDEDVRGYLFQGRFFSCPLDEPHLVAAARYVERNPVRAKMVTQAWDWPWSSARFHVGLRKTDALVDDPTMFGLIHDWRRLLRTDPEDVDDLRERTRTGRPCGSA